MKTDGKAPEGPPRRPSLQVVLWLMLLLTLGAVWNGLTRMTSLDGPPVDYSTMYSWADAGRLERVTLRGTHLAGTLRSPTKIDGRDVSVFVTELPEHDDALLPLL